MHFLVYYALMKKYLQACFFFLRSYAFPEDIIKKQNKKYPMRLGKVDPYPRGGYTDIFFELRPNTGNGISFVQMGEFPDEWSYFALVIFYFFVENKFDLSHY